MPAAWRARAEPNEREVEVLVGLVHAVLAIAATMAALMGHSYPAITLCIARATWPVTRTQPPKLRQTPILPGLLEPMQSFG